MRCAVWVLCLHLLVGCGSAPPASVPVRVMSYNIRHGAGMDGTVDLERSLAVIAAQDPDVLALQEVDESCRRSGSIDQARWFAERLGMQAVFGEFMSYDGGRYGMAVLSRFPVVESRNLRLPPGAEPRSSVIVKLALPGDRELVVAGIHFYRDEAERMAQARTLDAFLEAEAAPSLLVGDFNSLPGSPVMRFLEEGWINPDKGEDRLTFNSVTPTKEIDYILYRPASDFSEVRIDVLTEPLASDHRPLIFDFRLN